MSYKQESVDSVDLERFLDFDQALMSPASTTNSKGKGPEILTPNANQAFLVQQQQQQQQNAQQLFSGPSHQYDSYTQQTGIPSGALANALAANRNTAFHLGGYTNTASSSSEVNFDFNAMIPQSFDTTGDMEMDFAPSFDGFYDSGNSGFVDPNMIGGREDDSPPASRSEPVRVWPGMHTRQAQLAKQQQEEIQRQQQQQKIAQSTQSGHKRTGSKNNTKADPVVEERISRLLNQMRHNSVASSTSDNATPKPTPAPQSARSRKEEEEMDEDERLLASEEGKKLSSKERRQLRNKVSARAFRSRRKEYISQLEGELSLKGQENDDLRSENDALKAENNRLIELSKMLLSSPAFSNFLNDVSTNGVPQLPASLQQIPTPQPQQQQVPKDVNPNSMNQQPQQTSAQIGMTLVPDNNTGFNNWNSGMDYDFSAPQVYAVTELPEGPAVDGFDSGLLSGKSSLAPAFDNVKNDLPVIESAPKAEVSIEKESKSEESVTLIDETVDFDESDPAFALFVDAAPVKSSTPSEPIYEIFGDVQFEKAVARFDLVIEDEESCETEAVSTEVSAAVMARFETICSSLDSLSERMDGLMARL